MEKIKENLKYIIPIILLVISLICIICYYSFDNKENDVVKKEDKKIVKEKKINKKDKDIYYYVDIKGAVNNEGVYKLKEDSRVIDVINEAGGLKENADTSIINLSKKVTDEMYIIVYTKEEIDKYRKENLSNSEIGKKLQNKILTIDENNDANLKESNDKEDDDKIININTATREDLLSITGIGESKADNIIKYREENGDFENIEDIKNVNGIGESLFEKIKDYIKV